MSKQLVDVAVWMYPSDALNEAIQDAENAANETHKSPHRRGPHIMYVLLARRENRYYGPVNEHKRNSLVYSSMEIAYTANPLKEVRNAEL
jgi:hypothetical protein